MLNSLISRGPTGGDFLRGGWKYSEESLAFALRSKELIRFLLSSPWSPWSSCSLWKVNSIDKMNSIGISSRSLFTKRRNVFHLFLSLSLSLFFLFLSLSLCVHIKNYLFETIVKRLHGQYDGITMKRRVWDFPQINLVFVPRSREDHRFSRAVYLSPW